MRRPGHATIVAYLALFVALGGSSCAALRVTGKHVVDGSLTGRDVEDASLKGRDIQNGTLSSADTLNGSVRADDIRSVPW